MSENPSANREIENISPFSFYSDYFQTQRTLIEGREDFTARLNQINGEEAAFNNEVESNHTRKAIDRIADQVHLYCEEIQELYEHFNNECLLLGSNDRQLMRLSLKLREMNRMINELAAQLQSRTIKEVIQVHAIKPTRNFNQIKRFLKWKTLFSFLLILIFLFFIFLINSDL